MTAYAQRAGCDPLQAVWLSSLCLFGVIYLYVLKLAFASYDGFVLQVNSTLSLVVKPNSSEMKT